MNVEKTQAKPLTWVRVFQRKLYGAAKRSRNRRFGVLYDKIIRQDVLAEAWERVARNRGSGGVDGQSIEWIRKEYGVERFLEEIRQELTEDRYQASAIRRVYIPKGDGQERPLGIPTIKDRVIQMAVKLIIEPLFEADFLECSYGFRPCRSNRQAAEQVHRISNYSHWAVDVDLKSYFDSIPHDRLMACVRKRVSDPKVLHLIRGWLKAGIMEEGQTRYVTSGTPQGGVLSPLLSNIYLHELDERMRSADGKYIRFADDMVVLCGTEAQAQAALRVVQQFLTELGLAWNEDKTGVRPIREGFDFLGFTYRAGYSRRLKRMVRVKYPRKKSMLAISRRMKETIKSMPLGMSITEVIPTVNRMLRGWANYFRIGNAYVAARRLTGYVCDQLRLFWRRRHHRKAIRGIREWTNAFFHEKGLLYAPHLL